LADMEKKLEAEKKRADELNDKYLRTAAEYENFRRRSAKERETVYGEAVNDTLTGLLPILDNLQYAAQFTDGDAEKFVEGVKLILGKLPETLEKMNIKMFGEPGETFNPEIHNAVMHIDDENYGEGEITDVLQCGYMYGDKVLRYAMVRVAN
ncbi:MAG: nucleotide exchange factor GrpE, partial [Clostridia bacterium]|nr:nucleotide exchange factor GrpE [Clostridia bacterium]